MMMKYIGTAITDALSVKEIYTILRPNISLTYPGCGESHPCPEIFYLSKGHHTLLIDKREYSLDEGQMIVYAPNAYHEASQYRPILAQAAVLTFDADSEILNSLYNTVITLTPKQRDHLSSIVDEGMGYFCWSEQSNNVRGMFLREGVDPAELWGLKKQIELFLIDVYQTHANPTQTTGKDARWSTEFSMAVSFLKDNLTTPLTLEQIAHACSMSVSKLKLLFREKAGMGPIDYLIGLRIEHARHLIREGNLNFTEIAEQSGFTSLHYFSRVFKRVTGKSPSQYAKGIRS